MHWGGAWAGDWDSGRQHGTRKADEPGGDPGIFGGKRGGALCTRKSEGGLLLGKADFEQTAVSEPRQSPEGAAEKLPGQDDRVEPGPVDTSDRSVSGARKYRGKAIPQPTP